LLGLGALALFPVIGEGLVRLVVLTAAGRCCGAADAEDLTLARRPSSSAPEAAPSALYSIRVVFGVPPNFGALEPAFRYAWAKQDDFAADPLAAIA